MKGSFWFNHRTEQRFRQLVTVKSSKIKLLPCCCILLTVLVLISSASSFLAWTNQRPALHRSSVSGKGYSIVMNTWKRYDLLKQSIKHYASCPRLESVHIVWSEPNPPSHSLLKFLHHAVKSKSRDGRHVKLKFDINKEDSLNNRFKEIKDLETDAIFSVDDDVLFPCSSMEFAFDVWQSAPDTMVGFVPRTTEDNGDKFIYGGWWSVWWRGTYSMVLSKAAFFHKKYLSLYTNEMPKSIKEFVTKNRNCEDIAMSFLVANVTGAPPIWVKGEIYEIGSTGISSSGGHSERRTECLNRFAAELGRMPLVSTTLKAVDSRHAWFW